MDRPVIAVGHGSVTDPDEMIEWFADRAQLRFVDLSDPSGLGSSTAGVSGLVVGLQKITAAHIGALDDGVRVIGRAGVGIDNIDIRAARDRGIAVIYEPSYGENEVATHALALLLALHRRLFEADRWVRDGWGGPNLVTADLAPDEMTVGVVGVGRTGRAMIDRLLPIAGKVIAYDPVRSDLHPSVEWADDLPDLLARSCAVTLHLPLSEATRGLFGRRELELLPPGALVINVSRGGIVQEDALAELLESGHLGGAGFDVFATEPLPAHSPLRRAPRMILTPHVASASRRAAWRCGHWTVEDVISWHTTGTPVHGALIPEETLS